MKKFEAIVVIFILSFFTTKTLLAQVKYSRDSSYIKSKTEANNLISNYKNNFPDTAIEKFHVLIPLNFMGNIGLPNPNYLLNYNSLPLGFNLLNTPYFNDRFTRNKIEYLQTKGPYANLMGIAGSRTYQVFNLHFTNTFKNKLNINLKFNRNSSKGFYRNQQTFTNNFYTSLNYTAKNKRSGFYAYVLANTNKHFENGGLLSDTLSTNNVLQLKEVLQVRNSTANRKNSNMDAMINPWFRLNKGGDSVAKHFLQFKTSAGFDILKFKDAAINRSNYLIFYFDTLKTRDSIAYLTLHNTTSYDFISKNNNLKFSIGYKNEINKVYQLQDSLFFNDIVEVRVSNSKAVFTNDSLKFKKIYLENNFYGGYVFFGTNTGNYKLEDNFEINFLGKWQHKLALDLLAEQRQADYIFNNWISNHYQWWNNGYLPTTTFKANFNYSNAKHFGANVFVENRNNYLYFDNVALPMQYNKAITNLGINLFASKTLLKHIGISINQTIQQTSNSVYVRLPQSVSTAKLFYTGVLAKGNLQLKTGLQVDIFSKFYPYKYSPATQVFYLQENTETGFYPYTTAYINARIKPVNFFIKLENVLQGFVGKDYFFVPGYYQPDRAFRFGLAWQFFD